MEKLAIVVDLIMSRVDRIAHRLLIEEEKRAIPKKWLESIQHMAQRRWAWYQSNLGVEDIIFCHNHLFYY